MFLLLIVVSQIAGCELLMFVEGEELLVGADVGAAAIEDASFMRSIGVAERLSVSDGTAALVIEDESLFFSRLSRVRIAESALEADRLYVLENGIRKDFASVRGTTEFGTTAIRFLKNGVETGKEYRLPGRLYRVNSNTDLVNVRSGRGINYKAYTNQVHNDQLILVVERNAINGWYKVRTGINGGEEFISAALLATTSVHRRQTNSNSNQTSQNKQKEVDYLLICETDAACPYLNQVQGILSVKKFTTEKTEFESSLPANEELHGYYKKVVLLNGTISTNTSSISEKMLTSTFQFTLKIYDVKLGKFIMSQSDKVIGLGFNETEIKDKLIKTFTEKINSIL